MFKLLKVLQYEIQIFVPNRIVGAKSMNAPPCNQNYDTLQGSITRVIVLVILMSTKACLKNFTQRTTPSVTGAYLWSLHSNALPGILKPGHTLDVVFVLPPVFFTHFLRSLVVTHCPDLQPHDIVQGGTALMTMNDRKTAGMHNNLKLLLER